MLGLCLFSIMIYCQEVCIYFCLKLCLCDAESTFVLFYFWKSIGWMVSELHGVYWSWKIWESENKGHFWKLGIKGLESIAFVMQGCKNWKNNFEILFKEVDYCFFSVLLKGTIISGVHHYYAAAFLEKIYPKINMTFTDYLQN